MQTLHFLTFGSSPLPVREIRHFDPPQTIELLMYMNYIFQCFRQQTKTKKKHVQENSPIFTTPKKGKNDGLESGDGEKRVLEKKKEQEDVRHHT